MLLKQKNNAELCHICGFVASGKSDLARHARRHAPNSLSWYVCVFSFFFFFLSLRFDGFFFLVRDIRVCCDCDFSTRDPASLLIHRRRTHGFRPTSRLSSLESQSSFYSVASTSGPSHPFSVVASTSASFSSQLFSAEASALGSSSSRPSLLLQSPSPLPSPSPAVSGLLLQQQPSSSPTTTQVEQHPIHISSELFYQTNSPSMIGGLHGDVSRQNYATPLDVAEAATSLDLDTMMKVMKSLDLNQN